MKLLKTSIAIILIFLTSKIALAYQFNQQINEITSSPNNASQCIPYSTNNFRFSENIEKEYLYNICRLSPDFKSFAFYYDVDNENIVSQILLPIDFESLQSASPYYCNEKRKEDIVIQNCNVFISSGLPGMSGKEILFSSPWTIVTNPKTIEKFIK